MRRTQGKITKLSNNVTIQSCDEMDVEYVEVSQHIGARVHPTDPIANHYGWQGKVYKINGSEPGYPNLEESTGYPDDILGLGGVNCRHRMFPFWKGISTLNPIKYDEEENKRIYEARQHQRKLERDMRLLKKKKACADAIGDTETSKMLEMKIQAKSNELNNWCKANNLKRDYSRELVSEQIVKNNQKGFTPSTKNVNIKETDLTEDEKRAITSYISSDAYKINSKIRNKIKLSNEETLYVEHLNSAINKLPKHNGNVIRDLQFINEDDKADFFNKHSTGQVVKYNEFISTTKLNTYNENANVRLFIRNTTKGADISQFNSEEKEVLFGTNYKIIIDKIKHNRNLTFIFAREYNEK